MRAVRAKSTRHSSAAGVAVSDVGPLRRVRHLVNFVGARGALGVIAVHTGKALGDSQYVYHRIVEPKMLLWLIDDVVGLTAKPFPLRPRPGDASLHVTATGGLHA
jgi:hypothetical protein